LVGLDAFSWRLPPDQIRAISIEKASENANDHEQRARVHPALPSYSVVVPAPELSSINVAVGN
jgi:hypothetical protein